MQNVSQDFLNTIKQPSRTLGVKVLLGNVELTEETVVDFTIESSLGNEGLPSLGAVTSSKLTLQLLNNSEIPFVIAAQPIKPFVALKVGESFEWVALGTFFMESTVKTDLTIKLECFDRMFSYEKTAYESDLAFPKTLQEVVSNISTKYGLPFHNISSLPNTSIKEKPKGSVRSVLSDIAELASCNAFINSQDKVEFKFLKDNGVELTSDNYIDFKLTSDDPIKITKLIVEKNGVVQNGDKEEEIPDLEIGDTTGIVLRLENESITSTGELKTVFDRVFPLTYIPYTCKLQGMPHFEVGDCFYLTDKKDVKRKLPITSHTLSFNGGLSSEFSCDAPSKDGVSSGSNGGSSISNALTSISLDNAKINNLVAGNISADNIKANAIETKHLSAQYLEAEEARIGTLTADKASIKDLEAVNGNITNLTAEVARIETLASGQVTSDRLVVANGFIKDAMIDSLNAGKIQAGSINTNNVSIGNDKIIIADSTQQFKDKNGNVRIQMGEDKKGDFNFIIRAADGQTTLIDGTGVKEKAIADGLIKDKMIGTGEIGGSKININSLLTEVNKDTNTTTIKGSKVKLDTAGQTLEVGFNSLKTQADATKTTTDANTTSINVQQGQIATAIANTKIVKDGKEVLLKDDYNKTVATVNSQSTTISSHTTTINEQTGKIAATESKVSKVEQSLNGLTSTVSSNKTDADGKITNLNSKIEQTATDVTYKFSQTGNNNLIRNSRYYNGMSSWSFEQWDTTHGGTITHGINGDNHWTAKGRKQLFLEIPIRNNAHPYPRAGYKTARMKVTPNKVHTLQTLYGGGSCKATFEIRSYNKDGGRINTTATHVEPFYMGTNVEEYHKGTMVFTPSNETDTIEFYFYMSENKSDWAYFMLLESILIEGRTITNWIPNANEIQDGITSINGEGVRVAHVGVGSTLLSSFGTESLDVLGNKTLSMRGGGMSFYGGVGFSSFLRASWIQSFSKSGVGLVTAPRGDYIDIGYSTNADDTGNFDYKTHMRFSKPQGYAHFNYPHPIVELDSHIVNPLTFANKQYPSYNSQLWHGMTDGKLWVAGDNGVGLCYKAATEAEVALLVDEAAAQKLQGWEHWNFNNYSVYNMRVANLYANSYTKKAIETKGVEAETAQVRYLFKDLELVGGKVTRSLPLKYQGVVSGYDVASIVCKGKGSAWVSKEEQDYFTIEGDCTKVNVEIILHLIEEEVMVARESLKPTVEQEITEIAAADASPREFEKETDEE